ncbi:MAG TPA: glycosyltransferase family 2 protein [Acidimicrobiia bacterium]|nr:glycosyltransferase family 2 protein [Acidimicrobiia bacterium]
MNPSACTIALMYLRAEMPFVAEWLDYHLRLGVDHVFLGLHVTEDLVDPSRYLVKKRPYAELYDVDSTEAELLERLFALLRPFAGRVSPYVVLRTDPDWVPAQRRFYNAVFGLHRHEFDWVCPHDIDEYLVPQGEFRTITAALADCPDVYDAVVMEQVVVEPRWDDQRRPRPAPLLVPALRRCAEVVPMPHSVKTFTRCRAAAGLDVHEPELLAGRLAVADRRLLTYHLRGFPEHLPENNASRLPVERQVYDMTDDRPFALLLDRPPLAEDAT